MNTEQCRAMARECYRLSQQAPEPEIRRKFLLLAVWWRELASVADNVPDRSRLH